MGQARHDVLLQLFLLLRLHLCRADCVYKECSCSPYLIVCSYKNLQVIPPLNPAVTYPEWDLTLNSNNISSIPSGSLPANLTDIDLQDNPITTMDDDVFDGSVYMLASLYMSYVRFPKIPNAIGHLRALTELSITGGNITNWNDGVWINLGQTLETLILENVGMTTWPTWIQYFTKLTDLTVTFASFSTIPDNGLDGVANTLKDLRLYNNRFTMVPKAISNLTSLQTLSIYQNHITNLHWLPHYSRLISLSINNNYLSNASHVSQALRPFNESLSFLDINYNLLTAIPEFSFLVNVRMLDFSHNKIYDSDSGSVSEDTHFLDVSYNSLSLCPRILSNLVLVTDFSIAHNNLKAFQESDFHDQVTSINAEYNSITELTNTSFPENFGLLYLQLNDNPLTTISSGLLQRLPHLYKLDLRHTKLTRLPLGLSYLSELDILEVRNCTALVCTCMESTLRPFIMRPAPFQVLGNCGQTSIAEFFSMLSPYCPTTGNI
ncbi:unnamed protein product [Candidula unifasciata]|uniref:Uncharacterized protein n=1 Tax=Candidula unifasciata TaxID=100452 RepID=A0A8S3Z5L8_9EUPU|nr:unnamed protein product [Candidula unifasciata]